MNFLKQVHDQKKKEKKNRKEKCFEGIFESSDILTGTLKFKNYCRPLG